MAATSIFKKDWQDVAGPLAGMLTIGDVKGDLLLYSDSKTMWGGFDQHFGGYLADPPPAYTTMRAFPGQTHSLMISSGERAYVAGKSQRDRGSTVYSRLAYQPGRYKKLHLCTAFTILGSDVWSWSSINFGFDIQNGDDTERMHPRIQLQDPFSGGDAGLPIVKVAKNNTRGSDGSEVEGGWATVPNSSGKMLGENENKGGWNPARFTIDLTAPQAGATHPVYTPGVSALPDVTPVADTMGRYSAFELNGSIFDLTGIAGVGQGWQKPQAPDPVSLYRHGANPGVGGFRSTRNPDRPMNLLFGPILVIGEK